MKQLVTFFLLIVLLAGNVFAADVYQRQAAAIGADKLEEDLPDEAKTLLNGIDVMRGEGTWDKFLTVLKRGLISAETSLYSALKCGAKIVITILICAVAGRLSMGISRQAVVLTGAAAVCAVCFSDFRACLQTGIDAIRQLDTFTKLLLPVMAGAAAASGGVTAAAGLHSLAVLFFQILISAVKTVVVPLIGILLAVSVTQCVTADAGIGQFRSMLTAGVKNGLKILTFAFSAFLSLTGIISGKADSMALKATKMAAGTVVPVVGSMISDASETILVSAGLLRDSVGFFGMFAVLAILIVPFLKIAVHYLVLQAVTLLCSFTGLQEHSALLSAITSCVGLLAGVTCCCGLFAFVACVCFIRTGAA